MNIIRRLISTIRRRCPKCNAKLQLQGFRDYNEKLTCINCSQEWKKKKVK